MHAWVGDLKLEDARSKDLRATTEVCESARGAIVSVDCVADDRAPDAGGLRPA
jgi:hypothetical protein